MAMVAPPAFGQQVICNKRDALLHALEKGYAETPVHRGLTGNGGIFEIVRSESGSWTAIITSPDGRSCAFAEGEAWQDVAPKPKGDPT